MTAHSSATPASWSGQRFVSRALQVFFRHPILYALPALAITTFGVYAGFSKADQYRSVGTLSVSSETFLGLLSDVRSTTFGYETPASTTSRQFNELMQTDGFTDRVAQGAGLEAELASGTTNLLEVRRSVYASAAGDSLMNVVALSRSPAAAQQLADSAISTFRNWITNAEIGATDAAEAFYNDQLETYKAELDAANDELTAYLLEHPAPLDPRDVRDTAEQLEIERLSNQLSRAQERFDTSLDKREAARQATRESSADIDQRLQIVDPPGTPALPETGRKELAMSLMMYGMLGLLVSLGAVVLGTVIDRSVLSPADLDGIGAPTLAVVPYAPGVGVGKPTKARKKTQRQESRSA